MITLIFPDGERLETKIENPSLAITRALMVSKTPSIQGTKMERDGHVFAVITGPALGWEEMR